MNNMLRTTKEKKINYIPGIDGLRAIAVLSVILFHFFPSILPGGFSGVDVFFVISGYVVSASLAKKNYSRFSHFVAGFYARRIVRIYPALIACILVVGIVQTIFVPASWLSASGFKTALFAFFGLSNFALIFFSDGYFSPKVEFNTVTHTWSLAVEEQFYLIFPVLFFFWLKYRDKKGIFGVTCKYILPLLLVLSLCYSAFETTARPDYAYYLLPSRFWELTSGAILFVLHNNKKCIANSYVARNFCIVAGFLLLVAGLTLSRPNAFPFPWALLSVIGALFVISAVASTSDKFSIPFWMINNPAMLYIGKISYSLYLWHWPVLVLFRWTVGVESVTALFFAGFITLILSVASYHLIEKRFSGSKYINGQSYLAIISKGSLIIGSFSVFTAFIFLAQPYVSFSVTKNREEWYPKAWPLLEDKVSQEKNIFINRKIFALGDSHVAAYSTMLNDATGKYGVVVQQYTMAGCSIVSLLRTSTPECREFIEKTLSVIKKEASPGDVVFLASLRMPRLGDQWNVSAKEAADNDRKTLPSARMYEDALLEADYIIGKLEKMNVTVILDAPKPVFKSPPFRCSDWFNSMNPICKGGVEIDRNYLLGRRKPVMESLGMLKKKYNNVIIWDTFPILCVGNKCSAFDDGKPLFFDGDHLSGHGNRVLAPDFFAMLNSIWK